MVLSKVGSVANGGAVTFSNMAAAPFDPQAMLVRFRERARAVRGRGVPPLEGDDRKRYIEQAQLDYQDFAMLADAEATFDDGVLTLRVDLRKG